jgi:hypothetical protein
LSATKKPKVEEKKTEVVISRKKDKVAIVGFAPTWNMAPFKDPSFEIWACNEFYVLGGEYGEGFHIDLLFELHSHHIIEEKRKQDQGRHLEWLRNAPIYVLMQKHYDDIPKSVAFPREYIKSKYRPYFTNTISFQIALAMELGYKEIHLFGINMANDEEYAVQRPSVEYFVGLAEGRGIKVFIPDESDICRTWFDYGFDDEMQGIMTKRLAHARAEHARNNGSLQAQAQQLMAHSHQEIGFMQAFQ